MSVRLKWCLGFVIVLVYASLLWLTMLGRLGI